MKRTLTLVLLSLLTTGIAGCSLVSDQTTGSGGGTNTPAPQKEVIIDNDWDKYPNDAVHIKDARIVGDSLSLLVSYGGGCRTHEFKALGTNMIMKSMPPQTNIMLSHEANNDMCEALITQSLSFGLSEYAQYKRGGIVFRLAGWDQPLHYSVK